MDEIDVKQTTGLANGRRAPGRGDGPSADAVLVIPLCRSLAITTRGVGTTEDIIIPIGPVLKGFGPITADATVHLNVEDASANFKIAVELVSSYNGRNETATELIAAQTGNGYRITVPLTDRTKFGMEMRIRFVITDNDTIQNGSVDADLVLHFLR